MNLKTGAVIDIIAPSSPPKNLKWKKGMEILQSWGLCPRLAKGSLSPWLFHSHTDKKRSYFLRRAFSNKESSVVWMLRGGYGLQKLMPSFIKNRSLKKKLFIGYSDGTPLHLFLNSRNFPTLHAPLIGELPDLSQKNLSLLKNVLFGQKTEILFKNLKPAGPFPNKALKSKSQFKNRENSRLLRASLTNSPSTNRQKILKASLTGGNLSLLSSSVGTAYFPSLTGRFLFIEDVNEEDYKVDRMLSHLFFSGALKGVKALLFGSFPPLRRWPKFFESFCAFCRIPLIFGLPCGHKAPHYPLPFNTPAKLVIQGDKAYLKIKTLSQNFK